MKNEEILNATEGMLRALKSSDQRADGILLLARTLFQVIGVKYSVHTGFQPKARLEMEASEETERYFQKLQDMVAGRFDPSR
jgi:hypothetical protein